MSQPSHPADRIRLGDTDLGPNGALHAVAAAVTVAMTVFFLVVRIWAGALVFGALLVIWLLRLKTLFNRRTTIETPAVLSSYGFSLRVAGRRANVPWNEVTEVRVYGLSPRYWPGSGGGLSLVAFLDSDSPHRDNPVITRHQDFGWDQFGDPPVLLGDLTTASEPMETVLTAVRGWIGSRLNSTPETPRGR
jgi:hypothetical protein